MGKKLLFINKYPELVEEFSAAMQGRDVEIDIATNGIEAAACLKKNTYQVAVTGLSLDGYNGEQIVTYLNKNFPDTICILYTTTISPAQLYFFFNERNVFRVFLRPVDFKKEFYTALEDAFEHYELRKAEREEKKARREEIAAQAKEMLGMKGEFDARKKMQPYALPYMKRLTGLSLLEYAGSLSAEEKDRMKAKEWQAAELCFGAEMRGERLEKAQELAAEIRAELATCDRNHQEE